MIKVESCTYVEQGPFVVISTGLLLWGNDKVVITGCSCRFLEDFLIEEKTTLLWNIVKHNELIIELKQ